jgi:hypothetical protein
MPSSKRRPSHLDVAESVLRAHVARTRAEVDLDRQVRGRVGQLHRVDRQERIEIVQSHLSKHDRPSPPLDARGGDRDGDDLPRHGEHRPRHWLYRPGGL